MIACGFNFSAAYINAIIWNWPNPDSELYVYILSLFFVSLLFGAIIVDITKSIYYTLGSAAISILLAAAMIAAPSAISGGGATAVDVSLTVALASVLRLFIIGVSFIVFGMLIGCFVGDAISGALGPDRPSN